MFPTGETAGPRSLLRLRRLNPRVSQHWIRHRTSRDSPSRTISSSRRRNRPRICAPSPPASRAAGPLLQPEDAGHRAVAVPPPRPPKSLMRDLPKLLLFMAPISRDDGVRRPAAVAQSFVYSLRRASLSIVDASCCHSFMSVVFRSSGYTVPLIFAIHLCIKIRANTFVFFVSLKRHNI